MAAAPDAIPAAPRKTLIEWIEHDGDATDITRPTCDIRVQAFHLRFATEPGDRTGQEAEPLRPPPGLRLPPLG
ncbi:hypothetical protein [Sphingobium sp. LB126]|uniref:hypothetical protein n=1 Tax=Sphingobium sp. LB126 TaxID=1983755 RepID=UPI001F5B258F|nr:hypothetical protein [Sphingobium sp. LB126]